MIARGLAALALLALAAGCGDPKNDTLLVLKVTTSLQPGRDLDAIAVTARPTRGREKTRTFSVLTAADLPLEMGFVPEGSPSLTVDLVVTAMLDGAERHRRTVRVAFVPDQPRQLAMLLAPCDDDGPECGEPTGSCDPEVACLGRAGRTPLVPYPGPITLPTGDAAVPDAVAPDAAADAAVDAAADARADARDTAPADTAAPDTTPPVAGTWSLVASDPLRAVRVAKIWPASASEVWVVGASGASGAAFVYDGRAWAPVTLPAGTPPLNDVFGVRAGQAWMVGAGGTILRGGRMGMTAVASNTTASLSAIWGAADDDLVAVGAGGTILQYRAAWTAAVSPARVNLVAVAGAGGAVWAVGSEGTVLRRAGGTWAAVEQTVTRNPLLAVWAIRPDDVWAVGFGVALHWDGRGWTDRQSPLDTAVGVWGAASNDVWMVGRPAMAGGSPIARWDGARWSGEVTPPVMDPQSVRGLAQGDVWVATSTGQILRFQGR